MTQKSVCISSGMIGGASAALVIFILIGGLYTITGPNGPVDTAYKMNRLTGQVWLVKTYTKQVGDIRVLTAREAEVEKTKPLSRSELSSVAMQNTAPSDRRK
jgi:hypothetical protein